jgi:uncharacterized protein YlzI (FlbEa/FlbD family)
MNDGTLSNKSVNVRVSINDTTEEFPLHKTIEVLEGNKIVNSEEMQKYIDNIRELLHEAYNLLEEAGEVITASKVRDAFMDTNQALFNK